jgi:hypothetical protein
MSSKSIKIPNPNQDQPGAFKAKLAGPTTRPLDKVQAEPSPRKAS